MVVYFSLSSVGIGKFSIGPSCCDRRVCRAVAAIRRHGQDDSPDVKRRRRTVTDEPDDVKRSRYVTHLSLIALHGVYNSWKSPGI